MKNNPYIGPRPYQRDETQNFFGRDREGKELAWLILAERAVLFYAQSGAGKTSLLNARVIPSLEKRGVHVLPVARVGSALPEGITPKQVDNIFTLSALLTLAADTDLAPETLLGHTLLSYLQQQTSEVCETSDVSSASHPTLLILDQFEEIATTHRDHWAEAEGFFQQVREALDALPGLGVLFVLREDYVAELDPYTPLLPSHLQARFRMTLPTRAQALQIVMGPAAQTGVPFTEEAAHNLVTNLSRIKTATRPPSIPPAGGEAQTSPPLGGTEGGSIGQYVEPVQLQVVCQQLWESLPDSAAADGVITWDAIKHYNVDDALTSFYEHTLMQTCQVSENLTGLVVTERRLRRWFAEHLITPEGRRGLALQGKTETAGLPNAVVRELQNHHLLRSEMRGGSRWYELAHDRLVEPVVKSNRVWEAAQDQVHPWRPLARQWLETRSNALLYRGRALRAARAWLQTAPPGKVEPYEREFIQESQQARTRRSAIIAAVIVLIAVLSAQPLYRQYLRWQAQLLGELIPIEYSEAAFLGDNEWAPDYALQAGNYPIEAFSIEKYEVTNERYMLCVKANVCSIPNAPPSQYAPERKNFPVTHVTALQANQFCAWIGRRLPTVWEWERAARPETPWTWPWGDYAPITTTQANFRYTTDAPEILEIATTTWASPDGVYDLAGNVWEWTCTPYTRMAYVPAYQPQPCIDLILQFPERLIIKGGGADTKLSDLESTMAYHMGWRITDIDPYLGFRCVSDP